MGRLKNKYVYVFAFLVLASCNHTRKLASTHAQDMRESNFIMGKAYWDIENASIGELDTAAYYFRKYLGDYTIKYNHPLTDNEEKAFSWLSEIYYRQGNFKQLDTLTKVVMRFYKIYYRITNSIWFNFSESNSIYPHNPEFDKKYTAYFKNLLDLNINSKSKYASQRRILESVYDNDQKFRMLLSNPYGEEIDSIPKAILDSIGKADSSNILIVSKIIKQYGWLGPKDVGTKATNGEFYTIHHADSAIFLSYYSIIKKAYKQGKLDPSTYKLYIYRRSVYLHKYHIYGTDDYYDTTQKKWIKYPIKK